MLSLPGSEEDNTRFAIRKIEGNDFPGEGQEGERTEII